MYWPHKQARKQLHHAALFKTQRTKFVLDMTAGGTKRIKRAEHLL